MKLALQLFDTPNGKLLANWENAEEVNATTGEHGFGSLDFFVAMTQTDAFRFYETAQGGHLSLNYGQGVAWEGRIEDAKIVTGGLEITALGYWRALSDVPYTALWSDSSTAVWKPIETENRTNTSSSRWEIDTNNRLYISPRKNESYGINHEPHIGGLAYQMPSNSSRLIVAIQYDYEIDAPSGWRLSLHRSTNFSSDSFLAGSTRTSTGAVLRGSHMVTFDGGNTIEMRFYYNGTHYTVAQNSGQAYAKLTNVRLATSTANMVNTTTTATVASGSQTITPDSMENIYVGQRLVIDSGETTSESVIVTAITTTTFTAEFANSYSGTTTIDGIVVYADEIVADMVAESNAVNPNQISADTSLIQSPRLDLHNALYEDEYPADILTGLALLGDNQTPPRRWEVGVWEEQKVHFRPRGSAGRRWSVQAKRLSVNGSVKTLFNSVYAVYRDADGRILRTDVADDADSQSRYGITRRRAVSARTTSEAVAEIHRDTALSDGAEITPNGAIEIDLLTDEAGGVFPKWMARSGDVLTLRNLPAELGDIIDKLRTFVLAETQYSVDDDVLVPTPESAEPTLAQLVARKREGL